MGCSTTPGALWIHVLDDQGKDIKDVKVLRKSAQPEPTNVQGLAFYEALPAGDYVAELPPLESPVADTFEPPAEVSKPVKVANGQIAYVAFMLRRKPKLKVLVYYKYDPKRFPRRLFKAATVTVNVENLGSGDSSTSFVQDGTADFGALPSGKYEVTAVFDGANAKKFEIETNKITLDLAPAEEKVVEFEVEPIYQTVQFVGHCLLTIPKQLHDGRWKGRYNGHVEDKTDIAERMKFLKNVIGQAKGYADDDPTNLKIFAVPECFFQGRYGAYLSADVEDLVTRLQDAVKGEEWKDWLFVFGTVNGVIGTGRTVSGQDMYNMAPVIKGGHGGVEPESFTRMVQKAEFSAELLDKNDWDDEWEKMLTRPVALNENMAFTGTENEEKFGQLLERLLKDDAGVQQIFTENGLTAGHWAPLKKYLEDEIGRAGLLPVVRKIRGLTMPKLLKSGKPPTLAALEFGGFDLQGAVSSETWQAFAGPLMLSKKPKNVMEWRNATKRADVLQTAKGDLANLFVSKGIIFAYQQNAITQGMNALDPNDQDTMDDVVDARLPPGFTLSPLPMTRKLLELYAAKKGSTVPAEMKHENFDYRDYYFVSPRKAGPLLATDAAAKLPSAKKVAFGVETCADHNKGRLLNALKQVKDPVVVDIQLIPSAGSYPLESTMVARDKGFIFNCDGWKVPSSKAQAMRDGKGMFLDVTLAGLPLEDMKNPLSPHTVVGTAGTANPTGKKAERTITCEKTAPKPLDNALADGIFGEGAGVLHVYAKKELPD